MTVNKQSIKIHQKKKRPPSTLKFMNEVYVTEDWEWKKERER